MIRKIHIIDAIFSLKPEYTSKPIITYSEDENVESAGTTIDWGGADPISNSDITAEQVRLQKLETDCYAPRRASYPQITEQLDKIYHSGIDAWKADIKAIKDKYPKP